MSAYLVDRQHIKFLASAAEQLSRGDVFRYYFDGKWIEVRGRDGYTRLGQILWDANMESIHARYPDTVGHPERLPGTVGESYIYAHSRDWARAISPVAVFKAINGLRYQSCEYDGWEKSEAFAILSTLEDVAIRSLPGYDEADWEVTQEPAPRAVDTIENLRAAALSVRAALGVSSSRSEAARKAAATRRANAAAKGVR